MSDTDDPPFDRDDTPFDGDDESRRIDAALDRLDARLTRLEALVDDGLGGIIRQLEDFQVTLDVTLDGMRRLLAWTVAIFTVEIVLGVGLVAWLRSPMDPHPPLTTREFLQLLLALVLGAAVGLVPFPSLIERDTHRIPRRGEVERQLRGMEPSVREEGLPEDERARPRPIRAQQAAIQREARRHLGLPEEPADDPLDSRNHPPVEQQP
jgi:hypothetical protein